MVMNVLLDIPLVSMGLTAYVQIFCSLFESNTWYELVRREKEPVVDSTEGNVRVSDDSPIQNSTMASSRKKPSII